jgi:hypothetical protein
MGGAQMAEQAKASHQKQGEAEKEHRVRHQESQPSFDKFHGWDQSPLPLTETPFYPLVDEHAALLASAPSGPPLANSVIHLQRTYGNRYVQRLLNSMSLRAKLNVNPPNDIYEQEADRVADAVIRAENAQAQCQEEEEEIQAKPILQRQEEEEEIQAKPILQRQEEEEEIQAKPILQRQEEEEEIQAKLILQRQEEEEEIQAKPILQRQEENEEEEEEEELQAQRQEEEEEEVQMQAGEEEEEEIQAQPAGNQPTTVSENLETSINNARGSGHPLSDNVREPMGQAFGADFSGVRVHTDSQADLLSQELSAKAFTTASDIFFRQGEYSPTSDTGKKLIAHELTHVVQQTGGDELRHRTAREVKAKIAFEIQRFGPNKGEEGAPGFNQLLNFWKGMDRSPQKYPPEQLKQVGAEYRGENISSSIAYDLMAVLMNAQDDNPANSVEALAPQFGWTPEDIDKYIVNNEPAFVKYMNSDDARAEYEVVGGAPLQQGNPKVNFDTTDMLSKQKGDGWGIYVMSPEDKFYSGSHKVGLFHHSSFLAAQPVAGAGELKVGAGTLQGITNNSGHYRPGFKQMVNTLKVLQKRGTNLDGVSLELLEPPERYKNIHDAGEFLRMAVV